jgi:hypothetical protein
MVFYFVVCFASDLNKRIACLFVYPKYWREIKRPSIMSEISIAPWNVVRMLIFLCVRFVFLVAESGSLSLGLYGLDHGPFLASFHGISQSVDKIEIRHDMLRMLCVLSFCGK